MCPGLPLFTEHCRAGHTQHLKRVKYQSHGGFHICSSPKYNKYFEFISIWYPFGKENIESILKGEANLGRILDEPSVYHIQAYQSDLLLLI